MLKITFRSEYKAKQGRKWVAKTSEWTEEIKTLADARLRAMALNWQIVRVESV